jgi:hypothetical protein
VPSLRTPKGTVTRHLADFNVPNLATNWGTAGLIGTTQLNQGWANLDTRGYQMVVWGITASMAFSGSAANNAESSGFLFYGIVQGTSYSGSAPHGGDGANPISPLYPIPQVALWESSVGIVVNQTLGYLLSGPGAVFVASPFPLAIVPAGNSLAFNFFAEMAGTAQMNASYTYYFEMAQFDH